MKKVITILLLIFSTSSAFSQAPEKMSYQAVIRNANNALLTSQNVGVRISILQGSISGSAVYVETQSPTTNANGLISIEIGGGTVVSGTFTAIDWSNGPFFITTETDPTGGTNYTITGTSQLMSVPYALYAKTSGSSTPGPQGATGASGQNTLVKSTPEAAGANCATGGIKLEYGLDANNDGVLDASEVNASFTNYVCNGSEGIQGVAGTNGTDGNDGAQGIQGIQGIQGPAGTNGTNGTNGATGATGANGKNSLTKTTAEAAGANCATGGTKVEFGIDANDNGVLDASEITASLTRYVCNGAQGAQGNQGPAGTNGTNGTNGATGATGAAGANGKNTIVKTTAESAGSNCPGGGVKLEYGLDANSNGTLESGEIDGSLTKYVCNGDPGQHPVFLKTNSTLPFPTLKLGKGILVLVRIYTQCVSTAAGGLIWIENDGTVRVLSQSGSLSSSLTASGNVLSLNNLCADPYTWTFTPAAGGMVNVTQGGGDGYFQEAKWSILGDD